MVAIVRRLCKLGLAYALAPFLLQLQNAGHLLGYHFFHDHCGNQVTECVTWQVLLYLSLVDAPLCEYIGLTFTSLEQVPDADEQ